MFRLRLFANRQNAAIRYKWIVQGRPGGSDADVENPEGLTQCGSSPYEYHYLKNNVARFTADEPGEYQIKLVADLALPDTVNLNYPRSATYVVTIVAEGESQNSGDCNAAPGPVPGLGALILLGLFAVWGLRRLRRQ